jgi:peptide/nickel transport system substrate-binding protein
MRFALIAALAAAAAISVAFASRSDAAATRQAAIIPLIRTGGTSFGGSLDVFKDQDSRVVSDLGLESLMNFSPSGKVIPWLAQSVTQPGRDVYVYHLRHGVKFWDGTELTSADVANSMNYERYPGSQDSFAYTTVRNVVATDRYTVVVTLKHPDPNWQFDSAGNDTPIFEKKFADAHKGTMGNPGVLIVGTGPWEFQSFDPTRSLEMTANPHWWGGKVNIQHISYKVFADQNSEALAFRAGDLDVTETLDDPRSFATTAAASLLNSPSLSETTFSMNVRVPPWNDVHVRRAVAYAINRTDVIRAYGSNAEPVSTLVLPSQLATIASKSQVDALLKSLPQYPFDLAKAKAELAKSAYAHGFTFTLQAPEYADIPNIAQVLAAELKRIGITATVANADFGAWFAAVAGAPDKRPTTIWNGGALGPDPSGWDWLLGSKNVRQGELNTASYTPPEMDTLVQQEETLTSPVRRLGIFTKMLAKLQSDLPYIPLYAPDGSIAITSKYTWPSYGTYSFYGCDWALGIKAK